MGARPQRIAVTLGDPGGIGPEVTLKALREFRLDPRSELVIFGPLAALELLEKKGCGPKILREPVAGKNRGVKSGRKKESRIYFCDTSQKAGDLLARKFSGRRHPLTGKLEKGHFEAGRVSLANAFQAYAALEEATRHTRSGTFAALVTAPVNKTAMRLIAPGFHGHTEYLAAKAGVKNYAMMFVSPRLKVTLATIHVPLRRVSGLITRKLVFEKIRLTDQFLKKFMRLGRPRIAVCALNPHGSETGPEDARAIAPAVREAKQAGIRAEGPLSADRVFYDAYEGRFEAVISMYHDQGLAPFKMIAFRDGVNVTLGLPFIRTSPDHGTGFDIAYQDKADAASMLASLELAQKLVLGKAGR